ncbi:hypothetical protein [Aquincola tertiaricarbonis]|uniref:hypothetical protein n=1 Tax=Aquincola tertiaricarbonis TaxID=391953 RepID=UPI000A6CCB2E|nr:hypothetical protein [Aquincola tertiaricarbonis]
MTVQDLLDRREWKLPYAAIEPPAPNVRPAQGRCGSAAAGTAQAHTQRRPLW